MCRSRPICSFDPIHESEWISLRSHCSSTSHQRNVPFFWSGVFKESMAKWFCFWFAFAESRIMLLETQNKVTKYNKYRFGIWNWIMLLYVSIKYELNVKKKVHLHLHRYKQLLPSLKFQNLKPSFIFWIDGMEWLHVVYIRMICYELRVSWK